MRTNLINLTFMIVLAVSSCSNSLHSNLINQFVELNNKLGNPAEDVGVVIANVKNVINDEEKKNAEHFAFLLSNCLNAGGSVSAAVKTLDNEITESTNQLNTWKASLDKSSAEITRSENNIKSTEAKIAENRKIIDSTLEDFKVSVTETDAKLNVVKFLRDIITDELLNGASPNSFVQLNKFTTKLNELKAMLNSENDSLYTPLVSVLLELASEQNFSDQGILKQILQNINSLDTNLREFRKQKETALNSSLKSLRAEGNNLLQIRTAYLNMRAQNISDRIDATHYISFYTNEITHFNTEKSRKNAELALLQKICEFEKSSSEQDKKTLEGFKTQVVPLIVSQIEKLNAK